MRTRGVQLLPAYNIPTLWRLRPGDTNHFCPSQTATRGLWISFHRRFISASSARNLQPLLSPRVFVLPFWVNSFYNSGLPHYGSGIVSSSSPDESRTALPRWHNLVGAAGRNGLSTPRINGERTAYYCPERGGRLVPQEANTMKTKRLALQPILEMTEKRAKRRQLSGHSVVGRFGFALKGHGFSRAATTHHRALFHSAAAGEVL